MTAPWMPKAAELLQDRKMFPTSALRGMIAVAREIDDTEAADLYRAEIARRRAEDRQAKA